MSTESKPKFTASYPAIGGGQIQAAIWENERTSGEESFTSVEVTFSRRYYDDDSKQWKTTKSFRAPRPTHPRLRRPGSLSSTRFRITEAVTTKETLPVQRELGAVLLRMDQNVQHPLYMLTLTSNELLQVADISRITRDESGNLIGYQRPDVRQHVQNIVEYLDSGEIISRTPEAYPTIAIHFDHWLARKPITSDSTPAARCSSLHPVGLRDPA